MDRFPRSHAYRFERIRPVAPQREGFERDEPLLDRACRGWYLKYSSEPHRVTESVTGRSQGKLGGGKWLPRKPCVFTFLQEGEPEEEGPGECEVQEAGSVCLWGELKKRLQGPKCLGVSSNEHQPRCLMIRQNPGPSPGPMKQDSCRAEKSVFLTSSWPGNKQRMSS